MRQTYTLEEMRALAVGAYCKGYCDVLELSPFDDGFDYNDTDQIDDLIRTYVDTGETE